MFKLYALTVFGSSHWLFTLAPTNPTLKGGEDKISPPFKVGFVGCMVYVW